MGSKTDFRNILLGQRLSQRNNYKKIRTKGWLSTLVKRLKSYFARYVTDLSTL